MKEKVVLGSHLEEEQSLREKATNLKSNLEGLNSAIVSKQSEIDCLLAKVAALKSNKRKFNVSNEVDHNCDCRVQGRKRIKLNHERDFEPERFAETLLHEEIWRDVFSKVDDGMDLLNASRTCHHFHDILDPLKTTFLFENVLPFFIPYLDLNDVLTCRLVSKDWRFAINLFLEDKPRIDTSYDDYDSISFHPSDSIIKAYKFGRMKRNPIHFLQQFKSPERNPLIANSISIQEINVRSDDITFRNGVDSILETFGKHIYHFKWIGGFFPNPSCNHVASKIVRKLFINAPNVKTFVVRGFYYDRDSSEIEFESNPFVPNLETLAILMNSESPVQNWLFKNFHLQIKKLQVWGYASLLTASKSSWPIVTELGFHLYLDGDGYARDFLKCLESFPNLNKLVLFLPTFYDATLPKILQILKSLPTICPHFHCLVLSCDRQFPTEFLQRLHQNEISFATKELETLELIFLNGEYTHFRLCDFAFLLRFPYIKKLSITLEPELHRKWKEHSIQDKMEVVELLKYLKPSSNPDSSNVWRMLPNLETLQIQNNIYKRPKLSHTKS